GADTVIAKLTGPDSGSVSYGAKTLNYKGLEPFTTTGPIANFEYDLSDVTVDTSQTFDSKLYYDSSTGHMVLESLDGKFEKQECDAPTTKLKITGGSGLDDLTITSLDPHFAASIDIDLLVSGYDPFDDGGLLPGDNNLTHKSVIRVSGDMSLNG